MAGIGIVNGFNTWDKNLETFFHPAKDIAIKNAGSKSAMIKNSARKAGGVTNDLIYKASNNLGNKLLTTLQNTEAGWGKYLSKVPGLDKMANGLSKLGTSTGSKIPGLGTLFILGQAACSVFKAGKELLSGKPAHAGHTLLQSAGSLAGVAAGTALMMTGVGFIPGLALALGTGIAGDWFGKKVANFFFPKAAKEKEAAAQEKAAAAAQARMQSQYAAQGVNYNFNNSNQAEVIPMGEEMRKFIANNNANPAMF